METWPLPAFSVFTSLCEGAPTRDKHHHHSQAQDSDDPDTWRKREHYRHQYTPDSYAQKAAFRHASNSLGFAGVAGHMVRTGAILAPLVIGEFVKDPDKKWKAIRLTAVAAAVISEAMYAAHHQKNKHLREEAYQSHVRDLERDLENTMGGGAVMGKGH